MRLYVYRKDRPTFQARETLTKLLARILSRELRERKLVFVQRRLEFVAKLWTNS